MINTSEVLAKLGELIATDPTLASICASTFGRGCQVAVSGYAQKLMGQDDTPFVMVFPDEDEMDVDIKEVTHFVAKAVIGFCPVKDLPDVAELLAAANDTVEQCEEAKGKVAGYIADRADTDEKRTAAEELASAAELAVDAAAVRLTDIASAQKTGDYEAMLAAVDRLLEETGTAYERYGAIITLLRDEESPHDFESIVPEIDLKRTECAAKLATAREKWADFNENPFIADVRSTRTDSANGLTVFGSLNILDSFRNCLNRILNENDFGLPVMKVTMKNTSSSHYPLEWAEITIVFEKPETLSL